MTGVLVCSERVYVLKGGCIDRMSVLRKCVTCIEKGFDAKEIERVCYMS